MPSPKLATSSPVGSLVYKLSIMSAALTTIVKSFSCEAIPSLFGREGRGCLSRGLVSLRREEAAD
jgi:hypothetical protein